MNALSVTHDEDKCKNCPSISSVVSICLCTT